MTESIRTHILLADDDPEDQELLKEALAQKEPDLDITSVWDGQEVLSYLGSCPDNALPCLILLDYKMPVLNGAEVLESLCRDPRLASIPKVVWSSSNQKEYVDNCITNGALQFFIKPNSQNELKKIADLLLVLCHRS
ncbi:MAG TPA: response regulator [Puia sp.]|nr:response regulator [Puia sp.]